MNYFLFIALDYCLNIIQVSEIQLQFHIRRQGNDGTSHHCSIMQVKRDADILSGKRICGMQERRQHEIAQEEKKEDWLDKYEFHRCIFVEALVNSYKSMG